MNQSATTYATVMNTNNTALLNAAQTAPTRTGYTFAGWFTAATGGTRVNHNTAVTPGSGAITVHAQWTPLTRTITFNPQGGTWPAPAGGTAVLDRTMNQSATSYATVMNTNNEALLNPQNPPTRTGYTFAGWFTAATGGTRVNHNTAVTPGSTTIDLHAQWTSIHTVTFDLRGGESSTDFPPQAVADGATATNPGVPTRANDLARGDAFIFDGWFTHPYTGTDDSTRFNFSTSITADRTLYARWTPVAPRINHIDPGTSLIQGTSVPGAYVRVYLPCGTIVDSIFPADENGNWMAVVFAQGRPVLQAGEIIYASQMVDSRRGEQSYRPVGDIVLNEIQLATFYTWRNNEIGRPHHVREGDGITMAIVLQNIGNVDAAEVRLVICAFDWLPYEEILIMGGNGATMYHDVAAGMLIFEIGDFAVGEEIVFFLSAYATRSVHWDNIPGRRITASGIVAPAA